MTEKWREDEEYMSYVEDLLETEAVKKLANYTQHVHSTRLEHSISVSYYSYLLAKKWGGNAKATARAGLLHDLWIYRNIRRQILRSQRSRSAYVSKYA